MKIKIIYIYFGEGFIFMMIIKIPKIICIIKSVKREPLYKEIKVIYIHCFFHF